MSDTDWKCDLCGRKREGGEKPPQGWVNTLRPCSFSGEMEDVVICGSCMACIDAARLADVNGLAKRIAKATYRFVQDGPYDRVPGEDFRECERMVSNILAPLLAENKRLMAESDARFQMQAQRDEARAESERRLKLLVECRFYVAVHGTAPTKAEDKTNWDLLTRIDAETGGAK